MRCLLHAVSRRVYRLVSVPARGNGQATNRTTFAYAKVCAICHHM